MHCVFIRWAGFVFVYLCICVFAYLRICVFVYLCICVFVYLYQTHCIAPLESVPNYQAGGHADPRYQHLDEERDASIHQTQRVGRIKLSADDHHLWLILRESSLQKVCIGRKRFLHLLIVQMVETKLQPESKQWFFHSDKIHWVSGGGKGNYPSSTK